MLVAIPLFGDEVSPRFGWCAEVLLATVNDGQVQQQEVRDVRHLAPCQLPEFLQTLAVEKVICGGVSRRFQEEMQHRGMEVTWGVIGTASDALAALTKGTLQRDQFVCRGRRGGMHRGGGYGWRGGLEAAP
jgi:predicted Fe-Mo cluster-binding NifX family protein